MRISDWSSDVCSSDLLAPRRLDEIATDAIELAQPLAHRAERLGIGRRILRLIDEAVVEHRLEHVMPPRQRRILVAHGIVIGRTSEELRVGKGCVHTCRSRLSPYH